MAIRVALNHKTHYKYDQAVWLSPHLVRLRPAPHCRTPILSYSLKITPSEHFINWQQDPYSNRLARLVFPKKTKEFGFEVDLIAELTVINPFDFFIDKYAEEYPFAYDVTLKKELAPYLELLPIDPKLAQLVTDSRKQKLRTIDFLVGLNQSLQHRVKYLIRMEPGIQSPEETLTLASGSCRDSAWLMVQLLRHLGLAARFVSGYLIQLKPDTVSLDGPSGTAVDFTDLHAWTEVYLPGAGWVGIDPTSGLMAGGGHIPLACTADPANASPVTGFFNLDDESIKDADPEAGKDDDRAKDNFHFSMTVTRIHEDPRVAKPYTEEQWTEIEALGHQVDAELNRGDVRLTMGGEPTFVSIDDRDGAEWNTAAMGPNKRRLGDELLRRLREHFAPHGLLHHGQGKWYPGEPLPRWAFGLYWRKDGHPVWHDKSLIADDAKPNAFTEHDAEKFIANLAHRLDVDEQNAIPGHEDAWYYLWKERRLPVNVDPYDSKLSVKEDRERLAKIFEQGLEKTIGYCLPLKKQHYSDGSSEWASGTWFMRSERMYLVPGDSPMGYRLPLDSIPWVAKSDYPFTHEYDLWAARGPLPDPDLIRKQRYITGAPEARLPVGYIEQELDPVDVVTERPAGKKKRTLIADGTALTQDASGRSRYPLGELPPGIGESASKVVRTALCVQTRGGILHVFMPPQRYLEDYLDLVTAVEDTAAELHMPVQLEGYTPPDDPRLQVMKVTPDPGVIEVNTQPAGSWDELVKNINTIYEEARLTRLSTEKFMTDGRHTGTGGGNHIIVGGATPADSPLLRRPDLLKSLLGYWHNHPSLSFLFSGMFVGPTSQAPRVDEARNDQVYELELAFKEVPDYGDVPPWLVDRIFRNILIDSTGNTHRSEFCIDKLYTPEGGPGRLGLLEMRAFEMPPHARMSLTQQLLLRSLISTFWKQPYAKPLVRWRTEIHDRFMLPYFVQQDFADVIADVNNAGYPLKAEWFAPHYEFRFPHFGTITQKGIEVELRQGIEPWHVLGEESAGGGTVRFVDSTCERVQVLVNGMVDSRHVIACNGRRVPLHPTGVNGQFIAGVRYRAWKAGECLHPTVPVHAPLVFDVIDAWNDRSIGGCTYHVSHPGGLAYETFPVNSYEAESRRVNRFYQMGHTPGRMTVPDEQITKEFPFTLDLRRN